MPLYNTLNEIIYSFVSMVIGIFNKTLPESRVVVSLISSIVD